MRSSKTFILLFLTLVATLNFIDRQIIYVFAPFIQKDLGLSNTELGFLLGPAFAIVYMFSAFPFAALADRFKRVNVLAFAIAMWSAFTAFTGLAKGFHALAIARMGVGIGEAGASPASQSMIADLYPRHKRATALAVIALAVPLGVMLANFIAAALIGEDTAQINWRRTFILLGVFGLAIALLFKLLIGEPKRGASDGLARAAKSVKPSFLSDLAVLMQLPSWWLMCLGVAFGSFVAWSFAGFQTKFILTLEPEVDFRRVLIAIGLINGIAYSLSTYLGAKLTDILSRRTIRAYGYIPLIAVLCALPLAIASFQAESVTMHLIYIFAFLLFLGAYLGPTSAIVQTLAPIHIRATSAALYGFITTAIALASGPLVSGIAIDYLLKSHSRLDAIRLAMSGVSFAFLLSALCFIGVIIFLPRDWKAAQMRNAANADEAIDIFD